MMAISYRKGIDMGGRGRSSGGGSTQNHQQPFKIFQDENSATTYMMDSTNSWLSEITPAMQDIIQNYTGSEYRDLNKNAQQNIITPEMEDLDLALSNYEVPQGGITTVRACKGTLFGIDKGYTPDQIMAEYGGKVCHNGSYTSTSALPSPSEGLMYPQNCVMRINVPSGKGYGAYIQSVSHYGKEAEFLLGRNVGFKVTGASYGTVSVFGSPKTMIFVDVEAVIM